MTTNAKLDDKAAAEIARIDAEKARILNQAVNGTDEEKRRAKAALNGLNVERRALMQLRRELATKALNNAAAAVDEATLEASQNRVENVLAALRSSVAAAVAVAQDLVRDMVSDPANENAPVAETRPPFVGDPEVVNPVLMRRTKSGHMVFGHVVRDMQTALENNGFDPNGVDMLFGGGTADALERWHKATGSADETAITDDEWQLLTGLPTPDLFDMCAQVTAAFEGHGFTKAVGDFDGAIATWGYHGYTLKYGHLQKVLERTEAASPGALANAFGATDAAALKTMFGLSLEDQRAWGRQTLLTRGKIKPSWAKGLRLLGEDRACQAAQLAYSREAFWQRIALPQAERLGLNEALSFGTMFDTAIQQGGLSNKRMARAEALIAAKPDMSEEEKRAVIVKAATYGMGGSLWKKDVQSRRKAFVDGTGRVHGKTFDLSFWGLVAAFDENEAVFASMLDTATPAPSFSGAGGYAQFFETSIKPIAPNFSIEEFLVMGGSNALGGSCAGLNKEPPQALWPRSIELAEVLQEFRNRVGGAVNIHSMYRSPAYNTCIGGVSSSQHMEFRAADLSCSVGKPRDWKRILEKMRAEGRFKGGIGIYNSFVHVDTRGVNANWAG